MPRTHRLSVLPLAAVLAATAAPLGAQHPTRFPTNDPVIERLWRLGMDRSHGQKVGETRFMH